MITADDVTFLRRAIGIAVAAIRTGDDPYGSLLAGPVVQRVRLRAGQPRPSEWFLCGSS